MIESFFQSLERQGVAYLLISGQAAILYGAAVFSEDVDLWVEPSADNAEALLEALSSVNATYYKLTPPLEPASMVRGHGFHFHIPGDEEFYLDVMGQPPRVPSFHTAAAAATRMSTPWGTIPVIGIKHLVALKTTQRVGDYPVVSRLVLRYLESLAAPTQADYRWAVENLHTADELEEFLHTFPEGSAVCDAEPLRDFTSALRLGAGVGTATRIAVERWLAERMLSLRLADREYWLSIIAELRELRSAGRLMPVGLPVRSRPPR